MTGTLVWCSLGKLDPEDIPRLLERRDRSLAGPTAPPQGLTLMRVFYDDDIAEAMPLFESWARRCEG